MVSKPFRETKVLDLGSPTAPPRDRPQHDFWQEANRRWWESHPMRYDWNTPLAGNVGERAWFEELDRRFFSAGVIPQHRLPFDSLIPFEALPGMDVLEIGVGMGSHAQLIAQRAQSYVGIDLTEAAVSATRRRFRLFHLPGTILRMDAESLAFPDSTFDLVWSWGVVHHSADTRNALAEIKRVLKPAGRALLMVYHKAWVPWYVYDGAIRGLLLGGLWRHGSINGVVQSFTDGALARYYTCQEWRREVRGLFEVERMATYGNRAEALPIPAGRAKQMLLSALPEAALRLWLTSLAQGRLLFSSLRPVDPRKTN